MVPVLLLVAAAGCAGPNRREANDLPPASPARPVEAGDAAAYVDGRAITWRELLPAMAESAGGLALEEAALDLLLDRELTAAGRAVSPADVAAERAMLERALVRDARADANDAARLLEEVRRSRGLGPARFAASLERTAKLRRLVEGTVSVTDEEVQQAFAIRHGPTVRVRVILTATEREAAEIRSDLRMGEEGLSARFARAAVDHSLDSTAPGGGEIPALSLEDPTYPAALRTALAQADPGEVTPVVAVDRGFTIALLEGRNEGDGVSLEATRATLHEELTRRRERIAMDDMARRLLRSAMITVQDRGLAESWERMRGR